MSDAFSAVKQRWALTRETAVPCGPFMTWWHGEYEANCELPQNHEGPHFDGLCWFGTRTVSPSSGGGSET